jgi:multidrug resistance protein, MATE family
MTHSGATQGILRRTTASASTNPPRVNHARIARLALPMTLANLSTPLLGVADAAIIGRLGRAHLLAAIAAAAMIFNFLFWSFGFLRMGTAGLVAQALGAGDVTEQRAALLRALMVAFGIGALMILLRAPMGFLCIGALDASPEVSGAARLYFDIRIWSAPFALANYAFAGALVGRGRTDIALALQILMNFGNISLNYCFVYGLSLGVQGSAAGTLVAEILAALAGWCILARIYGDLFSIDRILIFDRTKIAQMFSINRDIFVRNTALLFVFIFFYAQGARGGDVTVAANAVLHNLVLLGTFFLEGIATAAEQLCGQAYGARDAKSFRKAVRLTGLWCFVFAAGFTLATLLVGGIFIDFLTTNLQVRADAHNYLAFAAVIPLAGVLAFELDGVFIGAIWTRDMRNVMIISLGIYLASFYLLRPFGNGGLWVSLTVFYLSRGLSQLCRYRKLSTENVPFAQSAAATPIASVSRG